MMRAAPWPVMLAMLASLALSLWLAGLPTLAWAPAIVAGWYVADLASGVTHMIMDYKRCTPGVGLDRLYFYEGSRESEDYIALRRQVWTRIGPFEKLVYDFKNHHPRPDALGRRTMLVQIGSTIMFATLPVSLALNLAALLLPLPGWLIAGAIAFIIGATFAQYFHGTLHRDDNPPIVTVMRRLHLLMTPQAHALHHATLDRDFATNNGWSNPLVNRLFRLAIRRKWLMQDGIEPTA